MYGLVFIFKREAGQNSLMAWTIVFWWCHLVWAASGCNTGWFGSSCQYKCHCTNNRCDDQGLCLAGSSCERGWFGPLCQYQDLATLNAVLVPESSNIVDGQDVTWTSLQNVTIRWSVEYRVKWIQIVMGDTSSIKDVLVTFRNKTKNRSCIDQTVTKVNNITTDILCNSWIRTTQIFIDFRTSKNVASLHISGGRNLALKMATRQTSDYVDTERGLTFDSTRAVDGNPNGDFNGQLSCTHTEQHPVPSSWTVTFPRPQFVTRYVLYNRVDGNYGVRLKGFNLISYTPNNSAAFNYTDNTNSTSEHIYNVTTTGKKGVSSIEIIAKHKDNYLTLCEVEVYGDQECPDNTYGLDCSSTCNCTNWKQCFVSTGQCHGGCVAGFYGDECSQSCDEHHYGPECIYSCSSMCENSTCDKTNGICRTCISGYQNDYCNSTCDEHHYGPGCIYSCSSMCENSTCDKTNGVCGTCISGYQDDYCNSTCDEHHYGPGCRNKCSPNCLSYKCNHTSGNCLTCIPGRVGPFCEQACNTSFYGQNRTQKCSTNCTDSKCNNTDGKCHDCIPGTSGDFCHLACDEHHYGPGCIYNCSSMCENSTCDKKNGVCGTCISGYQDDYCNSTCDEHHYGPGCRNKCSPNCLSSKCNHTSGNCLTCIPGRVGPFCEQACDEHHYGPGCIYNCSSMCENSTCDKTNGVCGTCISGYQDDYCNSSKP
ncbi:cell death abnormality protein 1-like [Physella acuta]|uniref:cell death abnormality protein 1-like n=1 Tax=Physella acuta TaxID=109671 RepID=UPI0027DCF01F|nr:cell death abnormality protein 1-like [Physella acuta]